MVKTYATLKAAALAMVLTGGGLAEAGAVKGAATELAVEREAARLMQQIESAGATVRDQAELLLQMQTSSASRDAHFDALERIKGVVNEDLKPALLRLSELQPALPAWKQEAVNRTIAAAQMVASSASRTFDAKTRRPAPPAPLNEQYRHRVADLHDKSLVLLNTAAAAASYATARLKAAEAGLPVPTM